jgi:hypothetical protein
LITRTKARQDQICRDIPAKNIHHHDIASIDISYNTQMKCLFYFKGHIKTNIYIYHYIFTRNDFWGTFYRPPTDIFNKKNNFFFYKKATYDVDKKKKKSSFNKKRRVSRPLPITAP